MQVSGLKSWLDGVLAEVRVTAEHNAAAVVSQMDDLHSALAEQQQVWGVGEEPQWEYSGWFQRACECAHEGASASHEKPPLFNPAHEFNPAHPTSCNRIRQHARSDVSVGMLLTASHPLSPRKLDHVLTL